MRCLRREAQKRWMLPLVFASPIEIKSLDVLSS